MSSHSPSEYLSDQLGLNRLSREAMNWQRSRPVDESCDDTPLASREYIEEPETALGEPTGPSKHVDWIEGVDRK